MRGGGLEPLGPDEVGATATGTMYTALEYFC